MLSSILMESATLIGTPKVSEEMLAKYGYNSEHRIAMESAVELNDIFYESFYKMEELDFQRAYATMEGADESVLEGIGSSISERAKGAIEKIKTFLRDLWEKVKAFFHNVKRFLDGIFMNAQDFVKKYESELLKLTFKNTKYTVDMYDYDIDDCKSMAGSVGKNCAELLASEKKSLGTAKALIMEFAKKTSITIHDARPDKWAGSGDDEHLAGTSDSDSTKDKNAVRKVIDDTCEKIIKVPAEVMRDEYGQYLKTAKGEDPTVSDVSEAEWRRIRKGATGESDKKSVTVTALAPYVKFLKTSKTALSNFDKTAKSIDDMYKGVLQLISDGENMMKTDKDAEKYKQMYDLIVRMMHAYSTVTSKLQGYTNAIVAENRKALQEKIAVYKKICTSAFAHADKDSKK